MPFWDRSPTISSLVDRLILQMDLTFDYALNGVEVGPDDEVYDEWLAARALFVNEAGYQDASASYGVVFAGGAAVSAIGTRIENEGDITISNVHVHGLRSHVLEKYKVYGAATTVTMRGFFRDTFDWEAMTDDFSDLKTAKFSVHVQDCESCVFFKGMLVTGNWQHGGTLTAKVRWQCLGGHHDGGGAASRAADGMESVVHDAD